VSLRLIYMGTPDFAVPALAAILSAGHEVAAVYSQPPRPAGRGMAENPSPVHRFAQSAGIDVRTPVSLKPAAEAEAMAALKADAAVVAAYGLILPAAILAAPRLGCFNIHASLLPRWRGAAPIQRALLAGDKETGVTIMRMEAGLDTGPMLMAERAAISPDMNAGLLHDRLAALGADLIVRALGALERGSLTELPQPSDGVTYAAKITKDEARIDFRQPADAVLRQIMGFAPSPGAFFEADGKRIKVFRATALQAAGEPGTLLDDQLTIACGHGAIRLDQVQREGKAVMDRDAFLRGTPLKAGTKLG